MQSFVSGGGQDHEAGQGDESGERGRGGRRAGWPSDTAGGGPIGLIGTGKMGVPMARRIASAGHDLVLYNRTPTRAEPLAAEIGGALGADPADVASRCGVTLVMVGDEAAAEEVFFGGRGLVHGIAPGSLIAVMSTLGPAVVTGIGERLNGTGASVLDAPVSGTPTAVSAGELLVMVGGEPDDLERCRPIFETFARSIVHLGPLGSGSAMKLVVNSLVFAVAEGIAESLVLAERWGVDRETAYAVLLDSAVTNPMMRHRRTLFVHPGTGEPAFRMVLAEKDLRLVTELARSVGAPVPQASLVRSLMADAIAAGLGDEDLSALAVHLRRRAGEAQVAASPQTFEEGRVT